MNSIDIVSTYIIILTLLFVRAFALSYTSCVSFPSMAGIYSNKMLFFSVHHFVKTLLFTLF